MCHGQKTPVLGLIGVVIHLVVSILHDHSNDVYLGNHVPIGQRNGVLTMPHMVFKGTSVGSTLPPNSMKPGVRVVLEDHSPFKGPNVGFHVNLCQKWRSSDLHSSDGMSHAHRLKKP